MEIRCEEGGMSLSQYEQRMLAAIEEGLGAEDPELVKVLTKTRLPLSPPKLGIPVRHVATLAAALLTLITLHALAGGLHPAASAALTTALIVSWLWSAARATGAGDREDPASDPGASRPATARGAGDVGLEK
jgi:hypothetical protein